MKYIYDILLNFDEKAVYDFYEWNIEDGIEYFKRMPLIRTDDDTYRKLMIDSVIKDTVILGKIFNMTEIYDSKIVRRLEYATVFADGKQAIATMLDSTGRILMMSKMLIDEEAEALELSDAMKPMQIDIDASNASIKINDAYLTRSENKKIFFLTKEIEELYRNKNINKLKYLYYECFNKMEDDINLIYQALKLFLKSEYNIKHDELYNLIRLSYSKK